MGRNYKRKPGSRNYRTGYSEDALKCAINDVSNRGISIRKSAKQYNIPFGTLRHKLKGLHSNKVGRPLRLSEDCTKLIIDAITCLTIWKVPLTAFDISMLVKGYLDSRGVADEVFENNLPGPDWLNNFITTNNLTTRLADNVKSSRAEISRDTMHAYFDNLEVTVRGIPPENIYNYDETNITDNPGAKKVIVPRGLRRVERRVEHSKQSISVMFCGNASGTYLPPMVVYKAQNLYTNWTSGGPTGSVYDVSKSGWFDSRTFEIWFTNIFLPNVLANRSPTSSPIFLIGDNLPSHFSTMVINESVKHNIIFVTMPANSTHLCQPLDVAVKTERRFLGIKFFTGGHLLVNEAVKFSMRQDIFVLNQYDLNIQMNINNKERSNMSLQDIF